jgi:hypothetical protein
MAFVALPCAAQKNVPGSIDAQQVTITTIKCQSSSAKSAPTIAAFDETSGEGARPQQLAVRLEKANEYATTSVVSLPPTQPRLSGQFELWRSI